MTNMLWRSHFSTHVGDSRRGSQHPLTQSNRPGANEQEWEVWIEMRKLLGQEFLSSGSGIFPNVVIIKQIVITVVNAFSEQLEFPV